MCQTYTRLFQRVHHLHTAYPFPSCSYVAPLISKPYLHQVDVGTIEVRGPLWRASHLAAARAMTLNEALPINPISARCRYIINPSKLVNLPIPPPRYPNFLPINLILSQPTKRTPFATLSYFVSPGDYNETFSASTRHPCNPDKPSLSTTLLNCHTSGTSIRVFVSPSNYPPHTAISCIAKAV